MKRVLNDEDFVKSMKIIENEVAKIFGKKDTEVTASWNGDNKIEVEVI